MADKQTEKIILDKINLQGGVPTFFDNLAYQVLIKTLITDESKVNFKQLFLIL